VGLALAQPVASLVLPPSLALTAVSDSLAALLMLALLAAFAGNALPAGGRLRAFWIIQAVGWSVALMNQIWWMYYDLVLRKPVPMLFAGDGLLFVPGVLMLAGFLLRPHIQVTKRSARLGFRDFLLLMFWWAFSYVYLVMCWQYVSPNEALYNRNYDRLYMTEILIVVLVLGMLLKQSEGAWRRFYGWYLGAVLFSYLGFLLENGAIEQNVYFSGSWYDTLYAASLALYMILGMKGRGLQLSEVNTEGERYGSWLAVLAIASVLSLPLILLFTVQEGGVPAEVVHFRILVAVVAMFAMAGLVFMKQLLLQHELRRANLALEESSTTDPLTGIRNRRFFSATIEGDVAHAVRAYADGCDESTRDLIFYLIDLDNFKEVNDRYGHDAGDRVLIETARRISTAIRNSDVLVRWGGEEFLVVSRYTDRRQGGIVAQRVMDAVRGKPFAVSPEDKLQQTCSIGWAAFPWIQENVDATGYEHVLRQADRGLYKAKRAGKDQAVEMTPPGERLGSAGGIQLSANPAHRRGPRRLKSADFEPFGGL
jgi:diguanylate cyclase (GGDEF)-like protein